MREDFELNRLGVILLDDDDGRTSSACLLSQVYNTYVRTSYLSRETCLMC